MAAVSEKIVLYADDDPDDRELMGSILSELDPSIKLVLANDGQALILQLQALNNRGACPSLIILDMNMPLMTGGETLKLLKRSKVWRDIPVTLFTTSAASRHLDLSRMYTIDVVTKPATYNALTNEIGKMLHGAIGKS
jgi:CheY-like chemotaxis protein